MVMSDMNRNEFVKTFIKKYLPLIAMMVIIFLFSAMPGPESTSASDLVVKPILKAVEEVSKHPVEIAVAELVTVLTRKTAHFVEYAILGMLALNAVYKKDRKYLSLWAFSQLIASLYAISDELHQMFIDERSAAVLDVCIDSSGALLGIIIVLLIISLRRKRNMEGAVKP